MNSLNETSFHFVHPITRSSVHSNRFISYWTRNGLCNSGHFLRKDIKSRKDAFEYSNVRLPINNRNCQVISIFVKSCRYIIRF